MRSILWVGVLAMICPNARAAMTLWQVDDFQDGTTQNWISPDDISNVPGGQSGPSDQYLKLVSTGASPSSGLATSSPLPRWGGAPSAAGVTGVSMDLINLGTVELDMRVLINGNYGSCTSTDAFVLPPDGRWYHVVFGWTVNDMTLGHTGPGTLSDILAHMSGFQLRHQSGPPMGANQYTPVAGTLGIDNVTAVPEPMSLLLCTAGGILLTRWRRASRSEHSVDC